MNFHSSTELARLLSSNTMLLTALNLMFASTLLLLLCFSLKAGSRSWTNSRTQHLISVHAVLALGILPLFMLLPEARSGSFVLPAMISLEVYASNSAALATPQNWEYWAVALYVVPCLLLLGRLAIGLHVLRAVKTGHAQTTPDFLNDQTDRIRTKLFIRREVDLQLICALPSPASFGLIRPRVLLPAQAVDWSHEVLEDVLYHELQHIRRLDWLTTVLAYAVVCVYWMNPLAWILLRQLREETEAACDEAVVCTGRDSSTYASSLLNVARSCRDARRKPHALLQPMLDRSTLQSRIVQLLEEDAMKKIRNTGGFRRTTALLSIGTLTLLTGFSSLQMVSAQTSDARAKYDDFRPLVSVEPQYPTQAANEGIEGWVQVSFTVNSAGEVDADSIEIVDAEPADIFNRSARAATAQFRFTPPTVDGRAVSVPGVQYVFRYFMTEESENKWNEEQNLRKQQSQ